MFKFSESHTKILLFYEVSSVGMRAAMGYLKTVEGGYMQG